MFNGGREWHLIGYNISCGKKATHNFQRKLLLRKLSKWLYGNTT